MTARDMLILPGMYYDRRVDAELAETLLPGKPLSWLVGYVASAEGRCRHAHVQFRRDRTGARRRGSIQLYWGRASPVEFQLRRGSRVRLHAAKSYRRQSVVLFPRTVRLPELAGLETALRGHLDRAAIQLRNNTRRRAFLTGEAICHAGLMRRYGHEWQVGDPFVIADSEVRVGYTSSLEREAARQRLCQELGLGKSVPTKLDALGVLPTGDLALVEVKGSDETIGAAAIQVATHVAVLSHLRAEGVLRDAVQTLLDQKRAVGLIPGERPTVREHPDIVPWIAAPDTESDWEQRWRGAVCCVDDRVKRYLHGLRLARLSPTGHIVEVST